LNLTHLEEAGAGVTLRPPSHARDHSDQSLLRLLPLQHQALLATTDGLEAFGGHYRLFGVGPDSVRNLSTWNQGSIWKFAWPLPLADFLCFGESSFGDQYAYRLSQLRSEGDGSAGPSVYCLDGLEGQVYATFGRFSDFLDGEVETWISGPKDDRILLARQTLGDIQAAHQLNFAPPVWVAPVAAERLIKLDARVNMILNGDLYSQLVNAQGKAVARLEPWTDSEGRPRMRVLFAQASIGE
jgi:hypothetical protein